ncbi:hypothetical protein [Micromonospora craniellae]|uniref:DUF3558 domain-containing protein n=1 Tax=Micromonospora craniellae TaxID=2294034 RepID=A0A372FXS1_9ACTN|nr:hypothetical protein [Micromonospora craniellae]RFS45592.1 hypothetical protein D0Q02_15975 [Micromonospora craniellae]
MRGKFNGTPSTDGVGDVSCFVVRPSSSGAEARIDGLAWIGDEYEVRVACQLMKPPQLPAGAEQDLRAMLAAGIDAPAR